MNFNLENDFYGDEDPFADRYKGHKWFQDPPEQVKQRASAPPSGGPQYEPLPGVVEQNNAFIFALQCAPSVVYEKFKQFGQLGVLGWCSEFSDLIDDLKQLGFQGNMFVNTRAQALQTCHDLLKLNLDIGMQIIVMYLSSQVERLRRFLDGETKYEDYPVPDFPIPNHPNNQYR